ncbi:Protein C04F6.7 [Aphelenchoides avenae]|nr:Protein C04F6.7 [Aphelenchus avenae]
MMRCFLVQITNVARHLAAFHAQQLCKKLATSGLEGICYHKMPEFDDVRFLACFDTIRDLDPDWFSPLLKRYERLTLTEVAKYVLFKRPVELGLPLVLLHGDLWTNNIIHKKKPDGTLPTEVLAFIDWQTVFHGNPVFDLARFVSFCADAEVRREAEDNYAIVRLYYDELSKRMTDAGCPLNIGVDQFIEAYRCCQVHQAMQLASLAPLQFEHAHRGLKESIREALLAKFVLRLKFLLRDADPLFEKALSTFNAANHQWRD